MTKLYFNKYYYTSLLSIPILSYSYQILKCWDLSKNIIILILIKDANEPNNYDNKYLELRYEDINQSG